MANGVTNRGEFELINAMKQRWSKSGVAGDMGDDAALLPFGENDYQVVTTDMLIEGRHFKPDWCSWYEIGYKSIAVNLSDIAAMGAKAEHLFISLALTEELTASDSFDELIAGMDEICSKYNCSIDGGDTTRSDMDAIISVTAMGKVDKNHAKKRGSAAPGDVIAVTGNLGDAAAALMLLSDDTTVKPDQKQVLYARLHKPEPRLSEGIWLAAQPEVHAMMDISDGLAGDIRHIMTQSECGANINLDQLPVNEELHSCAGLNGWNAEKIAARGGDDYELLFTVDQRQWEKFQKAAANELGVSVTAIGSITDKEKTLQFLRQGKVVDDVFKSFDHFKS